MRGKYDVTDASFREAENGMACQGRAHLEEYSY